MDHLALLDSAKSHVLWVDRFLRPQTMLRSLLFPLLLASILPCFASAAPLDTLSFGNDASEAAHGLSATLSEIKSGGLGEPSRRLLPGGAQAWQGGILKFTVRVDPEKQNYFTIRLWGGDVNHNHLMLHVEGKQVGYRHLGDIEALDPGCDAPAYPGRFCYRTCPLPIELTKGKDRVTCEIRATGPIWGYGTGLRRIPEADHRATRGIYRAYTHTDGCFTPPADEKQGVYPEDAPLRTGPGPEVMEALKARVNREIDGLLRDPKRPCNQMQMHFLAQAYHTPWTKAAGKPATVEKILTSLDALYRAYVANPKTRRSGAVHLQPRLVRTRSRRAGDRSAGKGTRACVRRHHRRRPGPSGEAPRRLPRHAGRLPRLAPRAPAAVHQPVDDQRPLRHLPGQPRDRHRRPGPGAAGEAGAPLPSRIDRPRALARQRDRRQAGPSARR